MSERPRSRRFVENVGWNLLRQGSTLLMSFFLTPILVHGLGKEGYGLYALIGVLMGILGTLVLGAAGSTIRLASEASPTRDARRLRDVFRYSIGFHLAAPVVACAALAAFAAPATGFFGVPAELASVSTGLLRWVALGTAFFLFGQAGLCMLIGMGRFSLSSLIESCLAFALLGGSALLVTLGFGLRGIGPWFAAANAGAAAWALAGAWRNMRVQSGPPAQRERPLSLRAFASESFPFFLSQLLWVFNFQIDKVFVAAFLPLSSLTYYVIPFSIAQRLESLPRSISFAAFQMAGEISGAGHSEALRRLYLKGTKLIGLALGPAVVLLFALAPQFLTLWLGAEFSDRGTWPFRIVLGGFSFYFLSLTALSIAQGIGKAYYSVWSLGASACVAFAVWGLFIPRYGVYAAAGGFLAAQAVSAVGLLFFFNRDVMKVGFSEFFSSSLLAPLASGGVLLVIALAAHPNADTWPRLILSVAAGLGLSFALSLALLDREERSLLRQMLRRGGPEPAVPPGKEAPIA